ncbi:hypothetical protein H8959_019826 [Pygathrix nigripes]
MSGPGRKKVVECAFILILKRQCERSGGLLLPPKPNLGKLREKTEHRGKPGGVGHPGWWPIATCTVGSGLCRHNPVSGWGWSGGSPGTLASPLLPQEPREGPPLRPRGTPQLRSPRLPLRPPLLHPHPSP